MSRIRGGHNFIKIRFGTEKMEVFFMVKNKYKSLAYENTKDFIFGKAKKPVTLNNGLTIGNGTVLPEINFTLSSITVNKKNMPKVKKQYREIVTDIYKRARELKVPNLIVEIELLPPTTYNPD